MARGSNRLVTGMDYIAPRSRRRHGRLQIVLGFVAVSAFGSAWLLRDGAEAAADESPALSVAAVDTTARPSASTAIAPSAEGDATRIPVAAVISKPAAAPAGEPARQEPSAAPALAALTQWMPDGASDSSEAAAVQVPEAAEDPDEDVVDSITEQIEQKPTKKKLTLPKGLRLKSSVVLVVDQNTQEVLAAQNPDTVRPIASLTKLMTAMVVTDAKQPLDETLEITRDDIDREKHSYSRLTPGLKFTRRELLLLALMSSENRAASALGRNYPGGRPAFIRAMNAKAQSLGMAHTHYVDSNGLSSGNVSTANDLVRLVNAAYKVPLIRDFSTNVEHTVKPGRRSMHFVSSNRLVRAKNDWRIGLQKTGFTNEAGRCLVMQATIKGRPVVMVLLDSDGKLTRFADAQRVRRWVESSGSGRTKATASSKASNRRARAQHTS